MEYQGIPVGLHPPVSLALAKAVKRIPEAGALPGSLLFEPKWDGFLHWTMSTTSTGGTGSRFTCLRGMTWNLDWPDIAQQRGYLRANGTTIRTALLPGPQSFSDRVNSTRRRNAWLV